jgi:hypothetical protein
MGNDAVNLPPYNTPGYKNDHEKVMMHLADPIALFALCNALSHGARKYGAYNWLEGMVWSRVYDGVMRHLNAFWNGEDLDPGSGLPHVDLALCSLMILVRYSKTHQHLDNRPHQRPNLSTTSVTPVGDLFPVGETQETGDQKSCDTFDAVSGATDSINS